MHQDLEKLARLIRYFILTSTTKAGSGHPTSSLSAADLMAVLMFGGHFKFDLDNPEYPNNDRLIFSKGHASPLFYSIYAVAGKISEKEMLSLRKFGSPLEGHPMPAFKYTEVPTGSLGQGLSVGVGMALNAKLDGLSYRTFVLLGDSEMAEGSVWEAVQLASHYNLDNLYAIVDVNRLGQRGETMYGHNVESYQKKFEAFGWEAVVIDGHNTEKIVSAYEWALGESNNGEFSISNFQFSNNIQNPNSKPPLPNPPPQGEGKPRVIIAKTLKGKGISFIEDKEGWHGKPLSADELERALKELGEVDKSLIGQVARPAEISNSQFSISKQSPKSKIQITNYPKDKPVATRKAYGNALVNLVEANFKVVVLDAEVSNSTYSELVKKSHPEKFIECFIAEQNMVGVATGLARRGKLPFISTFAAFFTRAFDQIRMSQYARANIKFCGSHGGVSIGEDGASQMGLEDIAMFRTLLDSVVLYPCDAISTEKLVWEAAKHQGNVYIRTTRKDTPIIYNQDEEFPIGGSKVLKSSANDQATIISAGITLHEALAAYEELRKEGINVRVIDLYSIKPIDVETLKKAAKETKSIITVEDHFAEGGIAEAVASTILGTSLQDMERGGREVEKSVDLSSNSSPSPREENQIRFASLAVRRMPKSGKPDELLNYEGISKNAIIKKVKEVVSSKL